MESGRVEACDHCRGTADAPVVSVIVDGGFDERDREPPHEGRLDEAK